MDELKTLANKTEKFVKNDKIKESLRNLSKEAIANAMKSYARSYMTINGRKPKMSELCKELKLDSNEYPCIQPSILNDSFVGVEPINFEFETQRCNQLVDSINSICTNSNVDTSKKMIMANFLNQQTFENCRLWPLSLL